MTTYLIVDFDVKPYFERAENLSDCIKKVGHSNFEAYAIPSGLGDIPNYKRLAQILSNISDLVSVNMIDKSTYTISIANTTIYFTTSVLSLFRFLEQFDRLNFKNTQY